MKYIFRHFRISEKFDLLVALDEKSLMFTEVKVCNRSNSCWTKEVGCMTDHTANMNKTSFTLKTYDTLRKNIKFLFPSYMSNSL